MHENENNCDENENEKNNNKTKNENETIKFGLENLTSVAYYLPATDHPTRTTNAHPRLTTTPSVTTRAPHFA